MDPNNPTDDQQQIQGQSQMPADNSQMSSDGYQAPMAGQEPAREAPVTNVVTEPPASPVTPQAEVAGGVAQVPDVEQVSSEPSQVSQEVPEQVNPIDPSQYASPTVSPMGDATPSAGEPSGGDNNPPQTV